MADLKFTDKVIRGLAKYVGGGDVVPKSTELDAGSGRDRAFKRLSSMFATTVDSINKSRTAKYDDYQYLDDNLAEASAALNLYADNVVSGSMGGVENYKVVVAENTKNLEQLEEVIKYNEQRSYIKDAVWEIAHDVIGYGDEFRELVIAQDPGSSVYFINKLKHLPVRQIIANVDARGVFKDPSQLYFQKKSFFDKEPIAKFEWWRLIHFKIGQGVYGVDRSVFAGAPIRIGRQLLWIDEALVIARMSRAWMRYAYLVDVEGMNPDEAWDYIETFMSQMTRKEIVDPDTGRISVTDKPPLPDEDIAIPVTKESKQDVKVLSGDPNIGRIEDVRYLQNKFLMALGVPKAYMAIEEGVRAKATIQQIDVQFARQVRRRQSALIPGLRQFYKVAFTINGVDPNSFKWDIVFPEMATTDEVLKWELAKTKAEIAKILMVDIGSLNDDWLFYELLQLPKAKVDRYKAKLGTPQVPTGVEGMFLSPHLMAAIRKNPEVRQMLNDIKDVVDYKIARDESLDGMVEIEGAQRTKELGDRED